MTLEDNRMMESEHLIQLHTFEVPRIKNYKQVLRYVEKYLAKNGPSTTREIWKVMKRECEILIKDFDEVSLAMAIGKSGLFRNENLKTNEHNLWTLPI